MLEEADIQLYIAIKKRIEQFLPEIKHIDGWNNQFNRSNGVNEEGRKENAFSYPCVFIQINPIDFSDGLNGYQEGNYEITLHLGIWSLADSDEVETLTLKRKLFKLMHRYHVGNWSRLLRRKEIKNFDNDNVNEYQLVFESMLSDWDATNIGTPYVLNNVNIVEELSIVETISFTQSQINI